MATQTRLPTRDQAKSGTWSPSSNVYASINTTASDTTYATHGTSTAGYLHCGFDAFSIPAGSTITRLRMYTRARKQSTSSNNLYTRIVVGGTNYNSSAHALSNSGFTTFQADWTTNPKTSAAWTVDQINGIGTNYLQYFGVYSTDANPQIRISYVYAEVTYTEPVAVNGSVTVTQGSVIADGGGGGGDIGILIDDGFEGREQWESLDPSVWTVVYANGTYAYHSGGISPSPSPQQAYLNSGSVSKYLAFRHDFDTPMYEDGCEIRFWSYFSSGEGQALFRFYEWREEAYQGTFDIMRYSNRLETYVYTATDGYTSGTNIIDSSPLNDTWLQYRLVFDFTNQTFQLSTREFGTEAWTQHKSSTAATYDIPMAYAGTQSTVDDIQFYVVNWNATMYIDDVVYIPEPPVEGSVVITGEAGASNASVTCSTGSIVAASGTPVTGTLVDNGFENGTSGANLGSAWVITADNGTHHYDNAKSKSGSQSAKFFPASSSLWSAARHDFSSYLTSDQSEIRFWLYQDGGYFAFREWNSMAAAFYIRRDSDYLEVYVNGARGDYATGYNVVQTSPVMSAWVQMRLVFDFTDQTYQLSSRTDESGGWTQHKLASASTYDIPMTDPSGTHTTVESVEFAEQSSWAESWVDDVYYSDDPISSGAVVNITGEVSTQADATVVCSPGSVTASSGKVEGLLADSGFENGTPGTPLGAGWTTTAEDGAHEYSDTKARFGNQSARFDSDGSGLWSSARYAFPTTLTSDDSEVRFWVYQDGCDFGFRERNSLAVSHYILCRSGDLRVYVDGVRGDYASGYNTVSTSPVIGAWVQYRLIFDFTTQTYRLSSRIEGGDWTHHKLATAATYDIPMTNIGTQSSVESFEFAVMDVWDSPGADVWVDDLRFSDQPISDGLITITGEEGAVAPTVTCSVGGATADGRITTITGDIHSGVACSTGTVTAAGTVATSTADVAPTITCSIGTVTAGGRSVTVTADMAPTVTCSVGTSTAAGNSATVTSDMAPVVACSVGTATASGPSITASGETHSGVTCSVGSVTANGTTVTITSTIEPVVACSTGSATAGGRAITIVSESTATVTCSTGSVSAEGSVSTATADMSPTVICTVGTAPAAGSSIVASAGITVSTTCSTGLANAGGGSVTVTADMDATVDCSVGTITAHGRGLTATADMAPTTACSTGVAMASGNGIVISAGVSVSTICSVGTAPAGGRSIIITADMDAGSVCSTGSVIASGRSAVALGETHSTVVCSVGSATADGRGITAIGESNMAVACSTGLLTANGAGVSITTRTDSTIVCATGTVEARGNEVWSGGISPPVLTRVGNDNVITWIGRVRQIDRRVS